MLKDNLKKNLNYKKNPKPSVIFIPFLLASNEEFLFSKVLLNKMWRPNHYGYCNTESNIPPPGSMYFLQFAYGQNSSNNGKCLKLLSCIT